MKPLKNIALGFLVKKKNRRMITLNDYQEKEKPENYWSEDSYENKVMNINLKYVEKVFEFIKGVENVSDKN